MNSTSPATSPTDDAPAPSDARPGESKRRDVETRPLKTSTPPRKSNSLTQWLGLAACLGLAALPMAVQLRGPVGPGAIYQREADTVAASAETWRQWRPASSDESLLAPLAPVENGVQRNTSQPAVHWLHMIGFKLGGHEQDDAVGLLRDARIVTVVMTLLLVAAVYWAGSAIGGVMPAIFAGLICASTPVLIGAGCFAWPVPIHLAWSTLAIAAALWAIRPLRPAAPLIRQALGWAICGLALGMVLLSAGPSVIAVVAAPLLLITLLVPHRLSHALGLLAAVIVAALLVTPWVAYVLGRDPDAWRVWLSQLNPPRSADLGEVWRLAGERLGVGLVVMLPWTLWLPAALAQPLSTSSSGSRQRMFIGWTWFVSVGVLLLFAAGTNGAQMILLLPVAAIIYGQLFRQFTDLSAEGRHARLWRMLRWPHMIALLLGAVLIPPVFYFQDWLVARGYLSAPLGRPMHGAYWLGAGAVLVLLAAMGARFAWRQYPGRALVAWSGWTVAAMILITIPLTLEHGVASPIEREARQLADQGGETTQPTAGPASDDAVSPAASR